MAKRVRNKRRSNNFDIIGKKTGFHSITPPMHQGLRDDTDDSTPDLYETEAVLGGNAWPLAPEGILTDAQLTAFFTGKIDPDFMTAMGLTRKNFVNFLNYLFNNLGGGGGGVAGLVPSVQNIEDLQDLDISNAAAYPHLSIIAVRDGNGLGIFYIWRDNEEETSTDTTYYTVVRDVSDTHTFFKLTNFPARLTKGATAPFATLEEVYNWYGNNFPFLREPYMQAIVGGEPEYPYLRLYPFADEVSEVNQPLILQKGSKVFFVNFSHSRASIVDLNNYSVTQYITLPSKVKQARLIPDKSKIFYVGQNNNIYESFFDVLSFNALAPTLVPYDLVVTNEWGFYSQENLTGIGYFSVTSFGGHTTITLSHNAKHLLLTPDHTGVYAIGSNGVSYIDVATKAVTQLTNSDSYVTYLISFTIPYNFRQAALTDTHFYVLARTAALNQYRVLKFLRSTHAYVGATASGNFDSIFANPESDDVFVYTASGTLLQKVNSDLSLSASLNVGDVIYPGFFYNSKLYIGNQVSRKAITTDNTISEEIIAQGENWYLDDALAVAYTAYAHSASAPNRAQFSFVDLEKGELIQISENGVYQLSADLSVWIKQTSRGAAVQPGAIPADLSERIGEVETLTDTQQATLDLQAAQIADLQTGGQGLEQFPIQNGLTVGRIYYKTGDSTYVGASPALESTSKMRGIVVGTAGGDLIGRLAGSSLTNAEISALNATGLSINSYGTFYLGNTGTPDTSFVTTEGYYKKVVIEGGNIVDSEALKIGLESYISRNETATGTDTVPSYVDRMTVVVTSAGAVSRTPSLVNEDAEAVAEGQQLLYIKKGAGVLTVVGSFNGVTDFTMAENTVQLLEFADGAWWKV